MFDHISIFLKALLLFYCLFRKNNTSEKCTLACHLKFGNGYLKLRNIYLNFGYSNFIPSFKHASDVTVIYDGTW